MTYSKHDLISIGKTIVSSDPEKARTIVNSLQPFIKKDISKIPDYFTSFCSAINVTPEQQAGRTYNRSISENNKVFISAMLCIYNDQFLLVKTISDTLKKKHPLISRHVSEVKFRYKKDQDFKNKVDNAIKLLS